MRFLLAPMGKMIKGFFTEDNGNWSMVRLLTFLCVVVALILALITGLKMYYQNPTVLNNTVIQPDTAYIGAMTFLILSILGLAFGAKVSQKFGEHAIDQSKQ